MMEQRVPLRVLAEENASPSDVEIMGYILLSLLHQNDRNNMIYTVQVVRWLTARMSSRGAFQSTQVTRYKLK